MIDYDEIFSHVVMFKSIQILLAMPHFVIMKFGKWMTKHHSLMEILKRICTRYNLRVLKIQIMVVNYASFKGPFVD
jgi:hypothetical protein